MKLAICVLTCRRPEGLRRLLESLAQLTVPSGVAQLHVVVVDNDAAASSEATCHDLAERLGLTLLYRSEARRGIPFARNAALDAVVDECDLLAFVDDDEVVPTDWLERLLACMHEHGADAVAAPAEPRFVQSPPRWAVRGRYFESPNRVPTGTRIVEAGTGNVLLRCEPLRASRLRFAEQLALTGGSDTHFFREFTAAGNVLVWCDDAVVEEWIPASRMTRRWLLRRSFRIGTSTVLYERLRTRHPRRWRAVRTAKALVRMAQGVVGLPVAALLPGRRPLDALRLVALAAGMMFGLVGRRFNEYQTIHGS